MELWWKEFYMNLTIKCFSRFSAEKECDLDKHCGVLDPERKKVCTRLLTCNVSWLPLHLTISCYQCAAFLIHSEHMTYLYSDRSRIVAFYCPVVVVEMYLAIRVSKPFAGSWFQCVDRQEVQPTWLTGNGEGITGKASLHLCSTASGFVKSTEIICL